MAWSDAGQRSEAMPIVCTGCDFAVSNRPAVSTPATAACRCRYQSLTASGMIYDHVSIKHVALGIEDILFVEGPPNALRGPALDLPLDITGMDRLARVLHRCVAQNGDFAGLRVHLHVNNVGTHRRSGARRIDPGTPYNGTTR